MKNLDINHKSFAVLITQLFQNMPIHSSILRKMDFFTSLILRAKEWSIVAEEADYQIKRDCPLSYCTTFSTQLNFTIFEETNICAHVYLRIC